tara:strand:+ start:122 stop:349 length:228 start_codon:yes stop_codon:yes gene_type:complete
MNNIEQIILSKLNDVAGDDYALNDSEDRAELASVLATELLQASLTELASYLHGTVPSSLFESFRNELNINPTEVP